MRTKQRVEELEGWIHNISNIQNQLLKALGYEIKWKQPHDSNPFIEKIEIPKKPKKSNKGIKTK